MSPHSQVPFRPVQVTCPVTARFCLDPCEYVAPFRPGSVRQHVSRLHYSPHSSVLLFSMWGRSALTTWFCLVSCKYVAPLRPGSVWPHVVGYVFPLTAQFCCSSCEDRAPHSLFPFGPMWIRYSLIPWLCVSFFFPCVDA